MKNIRLRWNYQFEKHILHGIVASGLLLLGFFVSCQKPVEVQTLSCNLETARIKFTEDSLQVLYRLETAGDFELKSFYYQSEEGKITINNPDTLIEIFITLSSQKEIYAGATGSARNGGIKVSYKAIGPAGKTYEAMDQCIQNVIEE
jgi:hypothetical protein